jgi:aspartate kinase
VNATLRVAVLKFGGTSVATAQQRQLARKRVCDARDDGFAAVTIVSAMGRPPEPYATDALLSLIDGRSGNANADLLLASGELIAAAVFAEEL